LRLTVRQLGKAYGYFWALKGLDLEIPAGQCVAVLGPNGAGKTTLLKLLSGLLSPTLGEIQLDGQAIGRSQAAYRAKVGLLAPAEHLYESLTARENLVFFTELYGKDNARPAIEQALGAVGLRDWSDEFVAALSSGMKCRLSIAKWQLLAPALLLLDEPYGVLDGSGVDLLEGFLKAHCRAGGVAVIASHHVARVLKFCDRALILHRGKLSFDEPRRHPWQSFERAFAEFMPHDEA
jgi:heme ABC exporter ATP-binding subunit CcmA